MFHQIIDFMGMVAEVIGCILLNSQKKLIPESVFYYTQVDIKTKRNLLEQTAFHTATRRGFTVNDET